MDNILEELRFLFETIETVLNDWSGEGCIPYPTLVSFIATKLNWDEEEKNINDKIIRYYIRKSSNWSSRPGIGGGVFRVGSTQSKSQQKKSKSIVDPSLKEEIKAQIEAKVLSSKLDLSKENVIDEVFNDVE